jgi:hypothetical protein
MYSVVYEFFSETEGSDFRDRIVNNKGVFPYNLSQAQSMQKESSLVGMVMAWSVVAIESLINHALAEKLDTRELAVKAINDTNKEFNKLSFDFNPKSKLGKKIMILDSEHNSEIVNLAEIISDARNMIMHDKPYDYYENDGDIETTAYRASSGVTDIVYRYEDLKDFFDNCDAIKNYIEEKTYMYTIEIRNFSSLLK